MWHLRFLTGTVYAVIILRYFKRWICQKSCFSPALSWKILSRVFEILGLNNLLRNLPLLVYWQHNSNNYLIFLFLLSYLFIVFIYIYISIVFIYSYIHSTTSWSMKKRKKELDHEFNLAILTSHLVNHTYLLPCCIISGFVHFYSSRLEEWWCTVSIFKKEAEVERIKKRRNFVHSSAAGFNRYVVNQSNKWNRCTRKAGNQETQQSYT